MIRGKIVEEVVTLRKIGIVLIVLLLIVLGFWFGGRWVMSFSVADYSGAVVVEGARDTVAVTFDAKGIPQIWAKTDADAFLALGWLHASERLFQMELTRRYVRGELSAIFGEAAVEIDKRQRLLRFAKIGNDAVAELSPAARKVLEKYCEGINAWIKQKRILPPEFLLLGITPEAWKPADCLGIAVYQSWYSHSLMDREPDYQKLVHKLSNAVYDQLDRQKKWSPTTIPTKVSHTLYNILQYDYRMTEASNSWVIAPAKSATGAAIHASDPHLEVHRAPGFWYIAGLHSEEGLDILGVTAPGLPAVVMGHNRDIAFAFTVASIDVIDYYLFQRNAQDSLQINTPDGWKKMTQETLSITVKGEKEPRKEVVYHTDLGPVVEAKPLTVTVLHWAGYDFSPATMVDAMINLQKAADFETFRRCVTNFGALDVNWTYSDRHGNIGYQLGTPIPRRKNGNSKMLLNGLDSTQYWQGYYPLKETPFAYNPPRGWLATCNNQIVDQEKWPYPLPGFYDPYRIPRATELLSEKAKYTVEDSYRIQMDMVSGIAGRWQPLFAAGARTLGDSALAAAIANWDARMTVDSPIAAKFRLWWEFMPKAIFEDELGDNWTDGKWLLEETLSRNWAEVIDNKNTVDVRETPEMISAVALKYVTEKFGDKNYGDISKLYIFHPLGIIDILDKWLGLNRGPYPMGGDHGTLNANFNFWNKEANEFRCGAAPSMRFVLDWADIDGFTIHGNLGQSGNPLSPHYDDFLKMWQTGERWVVPFSKEKVFEKKQSILYLLP